MKPSSILCGVLKCRRNTVDLRTAKRDSPLMVSNSLSLVKYKQLVGLILRTAVKYSSLLINYLTAVLYIKPTNTNK